MRADRFLRAFNQIESHLKRRADDDQHLSFGGLVKRAATLDPAVERFRVDLAEYAELRNAIVHNSMGDDQPIADPHDSTVGNIEHILEMLTRPPKLVPKFQGPVDTTSPDERIGIPAGKMLAGDFSQLPVIHDGKVEGLLTAETIARWLAEHLRDDDMGLVEEAKVEAVMEYTEDPDNHVLLNRDTSVFEAIAVFDEYRAKGSSLDAILVTHSGRPTESLQGIVTIYDMPLLMREAS